MIQKAEHNWQNGTIPIRHIQKILNKEINAKDYGYGFLGLQRSNSNKFFGHRGNIKQYHLHQHTLQA